MYSGSFSIFWTSPRGWGEATCVWFIHKHICCCYVMNNLKIIFICRREDLLNFIVSISPGQTVVSANPPPVDQLLRSSAELSSAADNAARHAAAGAGLPSLQDMLDLSRPERYKRPAPPSSPSHDESMDSPSCKRSRMN